MIPLHQLQPGAKFKLQYDTRGIVFELLYCDGSRARVRRLQTERVKLANGKEVDRLPRPVDISPDLMVELVTPVSAAR